MDPVGAATAAAFLNKARIQMATAAKIAKMNADAERSMAGLIEAASANMQAMAKSVTPPGTGGALDIST